MDASPSLSLLVPLPRPARGETARVHLGSSELVLEGVRGGHSLLWSDGRQARRYALGLGAAGHLTLQLRAPKLPVRIVPREVMSVVPNGRISGYVFVSLVPTLVWHDDDGHSHALVELFPNDLAAEWDEETGHSFESASPWCVRFPMRNGEPRAIVPIRLVNASGEVVSPANLPITLGDADLFERRGSIVVAPRRLVWLGEQFETQVRAAKTMRVGA